VPRPDLLAAGQRSRLAGGLARRSQLRSTRCPQHRYAGNACQAATAIVFVDGSDGCGGFACTNLALSTTTAAPLFSGIVLSDATGALLA